MKIDSVVDALRKWCESEKGWTVVIKKQEGIPNVVTSIQKTEYFNDEKAILLGELKKIRIQ